MVEFGSYCIGKPEFNTYRIGISKCGMYMYYIGKLKSRVYRIVLQVFPAREPHVLEQSSHRWMVAVAEGTKWCTWLLKSNILSIYF